jgi:hypothetical protein
LVATGTLEGAEMDVKPEAIRARLEENVGRERTAAEATGEVRWILDSYQRTGAFSTQTIDQAIGVTESWLVEKVSPEEVSAHSMPATMYAQFLADRVSFTKLDPPPLDQIDSAWKEWRKQKEKR